MEWGLGDFLGRNSSAREENFLGKQLGLHLSGYPVTGQYYVPWKQQEEFFQKIFSGRIKKEHWPEMGNIGHENEVGK